MVDRTVHARLSASGASRWMNCPGSVPLHELAVPDQPDDVTEYSTEGNAAHELGATCLNDNLEAYEFIGQKVYGDFVVTSEMADAVQIYIDFCRGVWAGADQDHKDSFQEIETSLSDTGTYVIHPDFGGISDYAVRSGDEWLHVIDYKHGAGVPVPIVDKDLQVNVQLRYYGVGKLLDNQKVKTIRLTIVQPRIPWFGDSVIRSVEMPAFELRDFFPILTESMNRIDSDLALRPGTWCQFCPAKIACPVMQGMFAAAYDADIGGVEVLTNDTLREEYGMVGLAKMYHKALEDEMYRRCNLGEKGVGYKLVQKFGHRVFKTDKISEIKEKFGDEAYNTALKSPAQIEKLPGGKPFCAGKAYKPQIGFTVVEEDDARAGVRPQSPVEIYSTLTSSQPSE